MAASASVTVNGLDAFRVKLKLKRAALPRELKKALLEAGLIVQTEARRLVQKSPRGGKVYQKYNPKRTHKASAPGQPPATDTGMLVAAITVDVDVAAQAAIVKVASSLAPYSLPLEFGTADGKISARPFMRPALQAKGAAATARIAAAVKAAMAEGS